MSGPSTSFGLYRRLLGYVRPYWGAFVVALAAMAATAATEPMFPALMKPLLDGSFLGASDRPLWFYPLAIVGIFLARGVASFIAGYAMNWVSHRVVMDVRNAVFERIVLLPQTFFDNQASARILSKVAYDVGNLSGAATSVVTVVVRDSLTLAGLLGWMLYLNWRLTLIALLAFPVTALAVRKASRRLRAMSAGQQDSMGGLLHALGEVLRAAKVIKVFGGQAHETERFRRASNALRGFSMRMAVAQELVVPVVQLLTAVGAAIVIYVALSEAAHSGITVGAFVSFITAMLMLLAPIKRLTDVNAPLQRGLAAAQSVFALIDQPAEADDGQQEIGRVRGRVEFQGVSARYAGAERDAVSDIDLVIEPGQTVALVGGSGGGKTTLANLLPRFYLPASGRILLDGHDIRSLRLASLRANLALVSQDTVLFDDTVAANIAYGGRRGASRGEIEAAARAAHALEYIQALPEGFETMIGENGARLSGGQRQRLAIARAVLKDAPVLILDEATSALDSESERHVQAALDALMRDRTTLVIAHRLSTIERADLIVVLEHGRIVERGRHSDLLARGGAYAQLYRLQFAAPATAAVRDGTIG